MLRADDLVGKPYREGACGPDAFDCYGLVKFWFASRGVALPEHRHADVFAAPNVPRAIARRVTAEIRHTDWREIPAPVDGCVMFMGPGGMPMHAGIVLADGPGLFVLNAYGRNERVMFQPLSDLAALGLRPHSCWIPPADV